MDYLTGNPMLTLPDYKEKRILFIQAEFGRNNKLNLLNENIRFTKDDVVVDQVSCHRIFAIFIIGEMSLTTNLLKKLSSYGISVFLLNSNLNNKVEIVPEAQGNYILRQKQYLDEGSLSIAKSLVDNKIRNQEKILIKSKTIYNQRLFVDSVGKLYKCENVQTLLGIEGSVSKEYFSSLFSEYDWLRRSPQTKEDITNLLLDIGYTYLFNYCDTLLRLFGFDTYKGYYHQLFFQRKSLSCDVMEPMRPIIDYQVLKSYHLQQIKEKDFKFKNGAFEFKNGFDTSK